ncbi:nucleoside-diphosphate sugar epimerase [Emticicia aquatilis]|uniref:Nucleoside-diphosphate sugar epimerase n=1 Tax=Emticicia aquatilis TaxID=1537369 RepID=A0A916YRI3_9BACT|nr:oxidoreductase [Emticicia aquatilis]GGD57603.1 nucleoside-diphosphate sugar epimerase [Emticicia aquatilis]
MKTALVVGASGLIGKHLTHKLLASQYYNKVTIIVRKKLDIEHQKLEQIVMDFDNLDASKIVADDIFCCLGTTMKQAGSKDAFYKVDFTYPLNFAKAGLANGTKQFLIITAMGADERSWIYYNRVKGEIEKALSDLRFPTLIILRPSMLAGERENPRMGEKIGKIVMDFFAPLIPDNYKVIAGQKVAQDMLELAQKGIKNKDIFESGSLQKF